MAQEYRPEGAVPEESKNREKAPSLLGHLHGRGGVEIDNAKPPPCREAAKVEAVPQKALDEFFASVVGHHRSEATRNQGFEQSLGERHWGIIPLQPAPAYASQTGNKHLEYDAPNQDNFSLTSFQNGFTLACVADGHGRWGHVASTRAVQAIPYFLGSGACFEKEVVDDEQIEDALISAFEKANMDVMATMGRKGKDVRESGSTVVVALWKGSTLWAANLGDSRLMVGSQVGENVLFQTEDHKPDTPEERTRIERLGGEVRTPRYWDNSIGVPRVYFPGQGYPGLAISRTLGDQTAKGIGVIAKPEVNKIILDGSKKPFLLLATDGVWELLDSRLVAAEIARSLMTSSPDQAVRLLQAEAWTAWKEDSGVFDPDEEDFYCDDMTSLLIQLS